MRLLLLFILISFFLYCCNPPAEESRRLPNILLIMADDLGYSDLGSYGQDLIQTPHLDRLAAEGIRFTSVYAGSSLDAPSSRYLLTGYTAAESQQLAVPQGNVKVGKLPNQTTVTIAELLKKAGYVTGMTGKWTPLTGKSDDLPVHYGFDQWIGFPNHQSAANAFPPHLWQNQAELQISANQDERESIYAPDLLTEYAENFIRENQDTTFFLYLQYPLPRAGYQVPSSEPYTYNQWPHTAKQYAAMISRFDNYVGRLMNTIAQQNLDQHTLIIVSAENSTEKRWNALFNSTGKLRGSKGSLFEGGLRIPMIIRYPEATEPGTVSDEPWLLGDLLPTIAALVAIELQSASGGINVWPAIINPDHELPERFLYWESNQNDLQKAIRKGRWKGIKTSSGWQLYNLATDPAETQNLSEIHPEIIREFNTWINNQNLNNDTR